jgi:hypothetical protein
MIRSPLGDQQSFLDLQPLLREAVMRTRMDDLCQLVDEGVAEEMQRKKALLNLFA